MPGEEYSSYITFSSGNDVTLNIDSGGPVIFNDSLDSSGSLYYDLGDSHTYVETSLTRIEEPPPDLIEEDDSFKTYTEYFNNTNGVRKIFSLSYTPHSIISVLVGKEEKSFEKKEDGFRLDEAPPPGSSIFVKYSVLKEIEEKPKASRYDILKRDK